MKKYIFCLIPVFILAFLAIPVISNGQISQPSVSMPEIVSGGQITVNGTSYELYPVYADSQKAITAIQSTVPTLLRTLSETYWLPPLSDSNWEHYRDAMFSLLNSPSRPTGYSEADPEYITLRSFFDIYENTFKNAAIINYVEAASQDNRISLDDLALLLPSTVQE